MNENVRFAIKAALVLFVILFTEYLVWKRFKKLLLELNIKIENEERVKRLVYSMVGFVMLGSYLWFSLLSR